MSNDKKEEVLYAMKDISDRLKHFSRLMQSFFIWPPSKIYGITQESKATPLCESNTLGRLQDFKGLKKIIILSF